MFRPGQGLFLISGHLWTSQMSIILCELFNLFIPEEVIVLLNTGLVRYLNQTEDKIKTLTQEL